MTHIATTEEAQKACNFGHDIRITDRIIKIKVDKGMAWLTLGFVAPDEQLIPQVTLCMPNSMLNELAELIQNTNT